MGKRCNFFSVPLLIFSCFSASSNLYFFCIHFFQLPCQRLFLPALPHQLMPGTAVGHSGFHRLLGSLSTAQTPVHTALHKFHRLPFYGFLACNGNTWTMDISSPQSRGLHILSKIHDRVPIEGILQFGKKKIYLQNIKLKPNQNNLDSQYFFAGATLLALTSFSLYLQ